jgi:hypothetical protein
VTHDEDAYERRVLSELDIEIPCAPDGEHCYRCYGVHNPYPGCRFVTSRKWSVDDDDEGQE